MTYNDQNREVLDQTPVALPVGYNPPESLTDTIQRMVRNQEYLKHFEGAESEEEANDFECEEEDDIHLVSQHQFTDMQEEFINEPLLPPEQPTEKPVETTEQVEKAEASTV